MSDGSGLCLQDLVNSQGQPVNSNTSHNSNNNNNNTNGNDHLHNHHSSLHDSVAAAVSVSSAITGLMSGGGAAGVGALGHLHHHSGHDLSGHHHHHHHHNLGPHTPSIHEPLEKLKSKWNRIAIIYKCPSQFVVQSIGNLIVFTGLSNQLRHRTLRLESECNYEIVPPREVVVSNCRVN